MKKVLVSILVLLVLIQFIRPEKNNLEDLKNDISNEFKIPNEVQEIIKTSCADCHSNTTKYPWYSEIAPVSWYLALHVNDGKEHLNFSEWMAYNKHQKEHIISDLEEVMESHKMPLGSYLLLHEDAKMTNEQYIVFLDWVKTLKK
ncbi:heme-binding domain-containing protein [Lutibacter sp. TH_r2]|uniref:heme-binding domain-containing protein n=1 Tax=Lutibacter sp. TH_r2 TaxID=3082083 RepID=UPI00295593C2|nr:heme-binding domain-containing protein [Lutibacter sp. TH_r2]MDV7188212.1 heme-binding domain-containing protein [Lutibacter sp. TH_r2]